jgi:hypothetical protein
MTLDLDHAEPENGDLKKMFCLKVQLKNGRIVKDPSSVIAGETPKVGNVIEHHVGGNPIELRITTVFSPAPISPSTLVIDEVEAVEI